MRLRPLGDGSRTGHCLSVVENEDRHRALAAQLFHFGPVLGSRRPGPELQAPALDLLEVVGVATVVQRFRGSPARVGEWRRQPAEGLAVHSRTESRRDRLSVVRRMMLPSLGNRGGKGSSTEEEHMNVSIGIGGLILIIILVILLL